MLEVIYIQQYQARINRKVRAFLIFRRESEETG